MYNEQSRPKYYYLLFFIVAVSIIGSVTLFLALGLHKNGLLYIGNIIYWLSFGFPIIIFICMAWSFSTYTIQYDGNHLSFGYRGWIVNLTNSEIISAKIVEINWVKWGGLGWKIKGLKNIGYIENSGPGLEILTTRKGRSYTFNCKDPQTLINQLHKAGITIENDSAV